MEPDGSVLKSPGKSNSKYVFGIGSATSGASVVGTSIPLPLGGGSGDVAV